MTVKQSPAVLVNAQADAQYVCGKYWIATSSEVNLFQYERLRGAASRGSAPATNNLFPCNIHITGVKGFRPAHRGDEDGIQHAGKGLDAREREAVCTLSAQGYVS